MRIPPHKRGIVPKRVVDGEGIWRSEKLSRVPEEFRAEYANLLPLALANGTFEVEPRRVWSQAYAFNRPDISVSDVEAFLLEFERAGMLFSWIDRTDGKVWGFWVGINKPGRLPAASRLKARHETLGPEPPKEALEQYLAAHRPANGQPMVSLGSGSGLGSAEAKNASGSPASPADATPVESVPPKQASPSKFPEPEQVSDCGMELAQTLKAQILKHSPKEKIREKNLVVWAREADRMMRDDGRTPEEIADLIVWCTNDDFWRANTLSMQYLRKKFTQLQLNSQRTNAKEGSRNAKPPGSDSTAEHLERLQRNAKVLGFQRS
jgi:hypothetical protein